jgi:hypothetical protein
MKHIQNNLKSKRKSLPAFGFLNSQKKICEPKVSKLLPNVCDFQKENHTLVDLKIYRKSIA